MKSSRPDRSDSFGDFVPCSSESDLNLNPEQSLENTSCLDTVIVSSAMSTFVDSSSNTYLASEFATTEFSEQLKHALRKLLRAFRFACDCNRSRWDFAVEINELREIGISSEELRWLIGKRLVDHAEENSQTGATKRTFEAAGGFSLTGRTCFTLTDIGIELLREQRLSEPRHCADDSCVRPEWDEVRHELRLGDIIVKKFKWRAANQEAILSAFEEEGWPPHIDDPLPPISEKDPKRRLSDAIKCLNRKQLNALIRFCGDGTGEGLYWEIIHRDSVLPDNHPRTKNPAASAPHTDRGSAC